MGDVEIHQQAKLREAEHFVLQMTASKDNFETFHYNLSAFLTAGRSVLQYCHEDVKGNPTARAWYEGQVNLHPSARFLKDKRDLSIHKQPARAQGRTTVQLADVLMPMKDTLSITVRDKNGNVIKEITSSSEGRHERQPETTPPVVRHDYFFLDWPGQEDVISLCRIYIGELHRIVADGLARGFLVP